MFCQPLLEHWGIFGCLWFLRQRNQQFPVVLPAGELVLAELRRDLNVTGIPVFLDVVRRHCQFNGDRCHAWLFWVDLRPVTHRFCVDDVVGFWVKETYPVWIFWVCFDLPPRAL